MSDEMNAAITRANAEDGEMPPELITPDPTPDRLTCSMDELKGRLRLMPVELDFTDISGDRFVAWMNGHCMLWKRVGGSWECDEL